MTRRLTLLGTGVALVAALVSFPVMAHDKASARYLGNEGVLVTRGDTKVLFDAFYAESFGQYVRVSEATEASMMRGEPPFDGIDAVFVSHIHPDHFNSRKVIAYLRAHPEVRLYAGLDVMGAIFAADVGADDPLREQLVTVHVARGDKPKSFEVGGVGVEAFAVPHSGNGPIPHYAFRVTLDQATTVMHLGDAEGDEAHFASYQADLDAKRTNLALVPFWWLGNGAGKKVIERQIRPDAVVGIHADAKYGADPEASRREIGGDAFLVPGETREIASPKR